jgi:hypothetical protein
MLEVTEKRQLRQIRPKARQLNLSLSCRKLILDEITETVFNETPKINQITKIRRKQIQIKELQEIENYVQVLGVDAGSQIIPLASRQYAVLGALAYSLPDGIRFFLQPEFLSQSYGSSIGKFRSWIDLRRETMLFETACEYLDQYSNVEAVLIDGPLALSNWMSKVGEEKDRQRLVNSVNKLLNKCHKLGIVIAGIVKRPTARHLVHLLGLEKETDFTDSFLMLHTLKVGERSDIFSPKTGLRIATRKRTLMDSIDTPIYSSYMRISKEWKYPPIRLDLPAYCLDQLDDLANYCYATSYWSGIPLAIVKADEEVKVSKKFVSDVYSEALNIVGRVSGEITQLAPYWGEGNWMGA